MRTTKEEDLINSYIKGYISREMFEMGIGGLSEQSRENILYRKAIAKWGPLAQVDMAVEEMSELIQAICKSKRNLRSNSCLLNIYEEIADVEIMLEQLKIVYDDSNLVTIFKIQKLERLQRRLDSEKEPEE